MKLQYDGGVKKRLDVFLHEQIPTLSRSAIQKLIKSGLITVNGIVTSVHHWLHAGDQMVIQEQPEIKHRETSKPTEEPTIQFQCNDYAVILKPAGMLIHPTERGETNTLADWLLKRFPSIASVGDKDRPGIVHRLDKDVGGLVLIALTARPFEYFKNLFHNREIEKHYVCLVHGTIPHDEGHIDTPVERSKKSGKMVAQTATHSGKHAITSYTVTKRFKNYTLLDVQILTGRTHQIRTHLYSIGHSIVGDSLYQTRDIRKHTADSLALTQPFLFAYRLSFVDFNGSQQNYTADLPKMLGDTLTTLQPL